VRHWDRLEGQVHRVDELAARFQGSAAVFDAYCRLLHDIGETALPRAFVILENSLAVGDPVAMLAERNSVFLLESLLRRYVYAEPHRLDPKQTLRGLAVSREKRSRNNHLTGSYGSSGCD